MNKPKSKANSEQKSLANEVISLIIKEVELVHDQQKEAYVHRSV